MKSQDELVQKIVEILSDIPWELWEKIAHSEPEWRYMIPLSRKYEYGPFAVTFVAIALNDFQLKGKADEVY